MKADEQLEKWIAGESICPNANGECCPDFSCCTPEILAPLEVRQKFVAADDEKRYGFLLHFLAALYAKEALDVKVRIFGEGREQ